MKYLFLSSHTDDSELCCGGTIAKLVQEGHSVSHISVSYCGIPDLVTEFEKANRILGAGGYAHQHTCREFLNEHVSISKLLYACIPHYEFVFTHSIYDRHSDHKVVAEQSMRIFNCNLATYIGPWNGQENPNYFVELSEEHLQKKIQALSCYKSQSHRTYMSPEFIRAQAIYNGIKCNRKYAEAFRIEKLIQ